MSREKLIGAVANQVSVSLVCGKCKGVVILGVLSPLSNGCPFCTQPYPKDAFLAAKDLRQSLELANEHDPEGETVMLMVSRP